MPDELDLASITMGLVGGMALFLYGMGKMTDAMKAVAGGGMRRVLAGLTRNRVMAALTGAFVTAVIQSSTVTTVLVVGFVSAGLMSLAQSVGVIMGANVGTTVTAQLIAFKVTKYALALIAFGFLFLFLGRRERSRQVGGVVMGVGLVFFGLGLMIEATGPLRSYEPFIDAMRRMDDPLLGVLVAAAFTALVHSSSATTGMVIVLASQGFITLEAGIALALGANVGTCITAWMAAIGRPRTAMRAAAVHVLYNVAGVLLWLGFIDHMADFVRILSPEHPELAGTERLAAEAPRQIANAHTLFNVANTAVFLWFAGPIARVVTWALPDKRPRLSDASRPEFLDDVYLQTPALAIDRLRLEIGRLGGLTVGVVDAATLKEERLPPIDEEAVAAGARDVELLSGAILEYSRRLSQGSLTAEDSERLERFLAVVNHLREIADSVSTSLSTIVREGAERRLKMSPETQRMFLALSRDVARAVHLSVKAVQDHDVALAEQVITMKTEMVGAAGALTRRMSQRLLSDDPDRVAVYRLESRVIEVLRRIYYFAKRIAKVVAADVEEPVEKLPGR